MDFYVNSDNVIVEKMCFYLLSNFLYSTGRVPQMLWGLE